MSLYIYFIIQLNGSYTVCCWLWIRVHVENLPKSLNLLLLLCFGSLHCYTKKSEKQFRGFISFLFQYGIAICIILQIIQMLFDPIQIHTSHVH